jgi:hypothetical protein
MKPSSTSSRHEWQAWHRAQAEANGWRDKDGILIPHDRRFRPDSWEEYPTAYRQELSDAHFNPEEKPSKPKRSVNRGANFTTKYAKAWARRQGWKIIDEERSSAYQKDGKWLRRTHDLMIGSDLMVEVSGQPGMTLIQAAGRNERVPHWQRFLDRGGFERCLQRFCRFVYVEFERGNKEPIFTQWWVEDLPRREPMPKRFADVDEY